MIKDKTLNALEFDKILSKISKFAVLDYTKNLILNIKPFNTFSEVKFSLNQTNEGYDLLYNLGVFNVEYFDNFNDELDRAKKGSTLSFSELIKVSKLLYSSRITSNSILNAYLDKESFIKDIANQIYTDNYLENEIKTKIINDTTMADNASEKLYQIRKNIKNINEKIREKLNYYIRKNNSFLQDNIVSVRDGRYVIPVKSEHMHSVKGFIHDKSQSGSTFFIEPQEILDLNNELRNELLNEKAEIERILSLLSNQVGLISDKLNQNIVYLSQIDLIFAKAHYAFAIKAVCPNVNNNGIIDIKQGRHPLIDKDKVIPIDVSIPNGYKYLLITGPNTGGKTVSLKLVGLFTCMVLSGIFIPAYENSNISFFSNIEVDVGDEQSIEQNLSTFSSHVKNIINILNNANDKTLVLIDEIGAGTDPDEGSALAKAILENLIEKGSYGIITTHYSLLKEYAMSSPYVKNASMLFDTTTFEPKYKINIGMPGSSNAIQIAKLLGLDENISKNALSYLSPQKIKFDNVLKEAEKVRFEAEKSLNEINFLKEEQLKIYNALNEEKEKFNKEKEKFLLKAKTEARKIVNDKLSDAEDILSEMKEIFKKDVYNQSDLVKMSTLKNRLENQKYLLNDNQENLNVYPDADINNLKIGDVIFVKKLNSQGEVLDINYKNKSVWVQVGALRINSKISDISFISNKNSNNKILVKVDRESSFTAVKTEINVIGKNVDEAIMEIKNFLDASILNNLEEVKIIHGKGQNILSKAIHNYLKTDKNVQSFRFGKYGEGEHGVSIIKLN